MNVHWSFSWCIQMSSHGSVHIGSLNTSLDVGEKNEVIFPSLAVFHFCFSLEDEMGLDKENLLRFIPYV